MKPPHTDTERAIKASNRAATYQKRAQHAEPGPERNGLEMLAETARFTSEGILGRVVKEGEDDG